MRKSLDQWKEELLGKTFGKLLVKDIQPHIRTSTGKKDGFEAVCVCACGKEIVVILSNLTHGNTLSCGCSRIETSKNNIKKAQQWFKDNPEKAKEINKNSVSKMLQWQKDHPEDTKNQKIRFREGSFKWRKENPEKVKKIDKLRLEKAHQWRKEHFEEFKEINKKALNKAHEWIKGHPEEFKRITRLAIEKAHKWQKENKEESYKNSMQALEKAQQWHKDNPEKSKSILLSRRYKSNIARFSKEEKEIYDFLSSLDYSIERQYLVEGHFFDFRINTFLIEYNGSIYHCSDFENLENLESKEPPSDKKDKNHHVTLRDIAIKNGFNLIHIWDYDWINQKEFIKKLIKDQLDGIANYKDYLDSNNLLNNDYGFNIGGEQVEPKGVWVSTGYRELVKESYSKGKVLVYNSGYTRIER